VVFDDIHIENLQNRSAYATMDITTNKEKLFEKQQKIVWIQFQKIPIHDQNNSGE
jgi:hypothetical protein